MSWFGQAPECESAPIPEGNISRAPDIRVQAFALIVAITKSMKARTLAAGK
jgi:hypothetical protein